MAVSLSDSARRIIDGAHPGVRGTVNRTAARRPPWSGSAGTGNEVLISTAAGWGTDKNVRRDSRVSLTVLDASDPRRYIEARRLVTVTEDPGRSLAVALAEKDEGPGAGQEHLDLPPEVVRVVLRISPQRVPGSSALQYAARAVDFVPGAKASIGVARQNAVA